MPISIAPPTGDLGPPATPTPVTPGFLNATRKKAIGHATYLFPATNVINFPDLDANAQSAIFVIEASDNTIPPGQVLVRFWLDGVWPAQGIGLPAYDGSVIEVSGSDDLRNARFISEDGNAHKINVQYFSTL